MRVLRTYVTKFDDASLIEGSSSIELLIRRESLTIVVTVPLDVHEWYVDVKETGTALEAREWYDYAGYESDPKEDLDGAMAEDLAGLLKKIHTHPLRMRKTDCKSGAALDCYVQGSWKQCVPAQIE